MKSEIRQIGIKLVTNPKYKRVKEHLIGLDRLL